MGLALLFSNGLSKTFKISSFVIIIVFAFFLMSVSILPRLLYYEYGSIWDLSEFFRFTPMLFMLLSHKQISRKINIDTYVKATSAYIVIDFIYTLCQYWRYENNFTEVLSFIFHAENHAKMLEIWSFVRPYGFSPNPGEHGMILLHGLSVLLGYMLFNRTETKKKIGIYITINVIALLIVQSKTVLVALAPLVFFTIYTLFLSNRFSIKKLLFTSFVLFLSVTKLQDLPKDDSFNHIHSIAYMLNSDISFEKSLPSSLIVRIEFWKEYAQELSHYELLSVTGIGKTMFSKSDLGSVFDNDIMLMYVSYGLIFTFFVYSVFIIWFINSVYKWKTLSSSSKVVVFPVYSMLLAGVSLGSISSPKILTMNMLLLLIVWNKKNGN